jgi:PAS domain-containing protein
MKSSITELTLQKVFEFSGLIKKNTGGLSTMEEVCQQLTKSLYQTFSNSNGKSEFALCRIFKSCSLSDFPPELKKHIRQKTNAGIDEKTKHIALLGTFGEKKEWCSISNSKNHKILSLNNPNTIKNFPMMLALFNQIGFEIIQSQDNGSLLFSKKEDHDFGLFLVKKAEGNALIPDQEDFVIPLGIKSVFGFGGMFSTGNIFAAIIFSKKSIDINQAEIFHSLVPAFKFAQVENELKGRIFKGFKNNSGKNKISEKMKLEVEKEKAATLNEELTRANNALLKLNEKLYRNNIKLNLTENKLTKSEERLQYALEASADGFWDWDIETGKVFYSKKWKK